MTAILAHRRDASDASVQQGSLAAGIGLLLMSVLAAFGALFAVDGLVTAGDAAQTSRDIAGSEGLFRLGILSLFGVVLLDVVVAWGLLWLLSPVDHGLAVLAAWLRITYAAVFLVAISHLTSAVNMVGADRAGDAMAKIDSYFDIWHAGLLLFGAHLAVIGLLALRSGFIPRWLGILLLIAGAGYVLDTVIRVVVPDASFEVSSVTFLGEFLLIFWLLIRGRRLTLDPAVR